MLTSLGILVKKCGLFNKNYLENAMSPISTPVNVRTPESLLWLHLWERVLTCMNARNHCGPGGCCQTPLAAGGILLSMMGHPLPKHSKRCQRRDLLCTDQHKTWAYGCLLWSTRNKKEGADGNYPGPSPSCPIIYTGKLLGVVCNEHSVKWTGFGSREYLIKSNKPFS